MKRFLIAFGLSIFITSISAVFAALVLSISAVFAAVSSAPFSDVPPNFFYRTQIAFFADRGVIHGYGDGTFKPYRTLNRAEAAKIISLATRDKTLRARNCYNDVKRRNWFSKYVCGNPLVRGHGDGSFRPGDEVTFGEALKMMFVGFTRTYPRNLDAGPWYKKVIQKAKEEELAREDIAGDETVSRGEFISMLYRFHTAYKDHSLTLPPLNPTIPSQTSYSSYSSSGSSGGVGNAGSSGSAVGVGNSGGSGNSGSAGSSGSQGSSGGSGGASSQTNFQQQTQTSSQNLSLQHSTRFMNAFMAGLQFFENHLSSAAGAIFSNLEEDYEPSSVVGINHEVLSESYGLALISLAQTNNQTAYEKYYQFLDQRLIDHNKNLVFWKLREDLSVYQRANAMIDDLRIIKGLLLGYEKFGTTKYRNTALAIADAIKFHGVRNNIFVNHIRWDTNDNQYFPASDLRLGYGDIATAKLIAKYDSAWNSIMTATQTLLINGQYPSGLFHERYRHDLQTYESDGSVETIFQAYIGEYLAEAGERTASQKMLNFFKNQWNARRKILNSYKPDGSASGSYENLAVYGILARMAHHLNDRAFAEQMGDKLISLLIQKAGSNYDGAFSWNEGDDIYSFNQSNALQALALLGTTPSLPPPPPPHQAVAANQFILWHMADVYYGSHHNTDCRTMMDDMDALPWNEAVVAGDLSGNGSLQNYDGFLGCVAKSSNPAAKFHIVAGNHEYNCDGSGDSGCLNNYKTKISSSLFYTWDYGNIHFIMFSPDRVIWDVKDSTWDWIRGEVANNQGKIVVLVNHHMPHLFEKSTGILNQYGVDLWLFGHAHCKHGDFSCTRHDAKGDFYQESETTFVDAGYIGNMESRYLIFTEGSNQVTIKSRYHKEGRFQPELEHAVQIRMPFRRN